MNLPQRYKGQPRFSSDSIREDHPVYIRQLTEEERAPFGQTVGAREEETKKGGQF